MKKKREQKRRRPHDLPPDGAGVHTQFLTLYRQLSAADQAFILDHLRAHASAPEGHAAPPASAD